MPLATRICSEHSDGMPGLLTALLVTALLPLVSPAPAAGAGGSWPVDHPQVIRGYAAPLSHFGPGHRGIDLAAPPGTPVRALAPGVVRFAGHVAGTPTVSITHAHVISSYQPVEPMVVEGESVRPGQVVGLVTRHQLANHSHHLLHVGVRDRITLAYLNPLLFLDHAPRLVPGR